MIVNFFRLNADKLVLRLTAENHAEYHQLKDRVDTLQGLEIEHRWEMGDLPLFKSESGKDPEIYLEFTVNKR